MNSKMASVTHRDGRVVQLENIRGSKIRFMILGNEQFIALNNKIMIGKSNIEPTINIYLDTARQSLDCL